MDCNRRTFTINTDNHQYQYYWKLTDLGGAILVEDISCTKSLKKALLEVHTQNVNCHSYDQWIFY